MEPLAAPPSACPHLHVIDLEEPIIGVVFVQRPEPLVGRVGVAAHCQQMYVTVPYPRHLREENPLIVTMESELAKITHVCVLTATFDKGNMWTTINIINCKWIGASFRSSMSGAHPSSF